jgi:hypothetical protein
MARPRAWQLPWSVHDAGDRCRPPIVPPDAAVALHDNLQIRRQLHLQRILNLGRLQVRSQQRRGREVGDGESIAKKIRATLSLEFDAVQSAATITRSFSRLLSLILWRSR